MKAILLTHLGIKDTIIYDSVPIPTPLENEALIRVKYCGINHLDLLIQEGKRPGPLSFPHILGSEAVGVIEKINDKRKTFKIGDQVAIYPWTFCGKCPQCLTGNENICDAGGTLGRTQWGGFAEYMVSPIKNLVSVPPRISLKEICALTLTGTTAYHLINRLEIPDHSTVLITGATGG